MKRMAKGQTPLQALQRVQAAARRRHAKRAAAAAAAAGGAGELATGVRGRSGIAVDIALDCAGLQVDLTASGEGGSTSGGGSGSDYLRAGMATPESFTMTTTTRTTGVPPATSSVTGTQHPLSGIAGTGAGGTVPVSPLRPAGALGGAPAFGWTAAGLVASGTASSGTASAPASRGVVGWDATAAVHGRTGSGSSDASPGSGGPGSGSWGRQSGDSARSSFRRQRAADALSRILSGTSGSTDAGAGASGGGV